MGYIIRLIALFVFLVPFNTIHIAATLVQSTLYLNNIPIVSLLDLDDSRTRFLSKRPQPSSSSVIRQEQDHFPVRYNPVLKAAPLEEWRCIERLTAYVALQYTCIRPLDAEKSDPEDSVLISSLPSSSSGRDSPSL